KADAHGMVDALEDKALVLRQHVREAAAELERKSCRIGALEAEAKDLAADAERRRERIGQLEADVDLALTQEKDELARYAIKKLLPMRHAVAQMEQRIETLADERSELEHQLAEQQNEFELLEQRVRGYLARQGEPGGAASFELAVTDEDVELELLRRRRAEKGEA
ncbi:MAG: PspA/IM30 family protein, partial [Acidobacteriota bacterium]